MSVLPPSQWYRDYIPTLDDWQVALANANAADRVAKTGDAMSGTLTINTVGLKPAQDIIQTGAGTASYAVFNQWPHAGFAYSYRLINCSVGLAYDSIQLGRGIVIGDAVDYRCGGSTVNGARVAHGAFLTITSPIGSTVPSDYLGASYVFAQAASAVIGSSGTNALGNLYASNPQVQLAPGATNYISVMGQEIDVEVDTGASVRYKWGCCVTTVGTDAVHGSLGEAGLHIGAVPSSGGWNYGIALSRFNGGGVPVSPTGTIFSVNVPWGTSWTCQNGIDLRNVDITAYAIAIGLDPAQPVFTVSGSGNVNGKNAAFTTLAVSGDTVSSGKTSAVGGLSVGGPLNLRITAPPVSATAPGAVGDVIIGTDNFLYVCVSTNVWRRSALVTW